MFLTKDLANNLYTPNQTNKRTKENSSSGGSVRVVSKTAQLNRNMEGYDHNGSLYAPFLSLKSHSKPELHQGEEEGSKARSEGCSRSIESKKKGKKQRFAFQTRSQVDILDDGYRWRKYGQKAVKNNKFPRSYYRCTYGGCNVKKQVQRLTVDQEVVVTTYEGVHSHPIEKSTENFEHILTQMQIYSSF